MKQLDLKSFMIFIVILLGIIILQDYYKASEVTQPSNTEPQEITVVSNSQDAEGLTTENINGDFLKYFESTSIEGVRGKVRANFASQGLQEPTMNIQAASSLAEKGNVKLAILKLTITSADHRLLGSRQVFIAGVKDGQLKRVLCARNNDVEIPITYGVCAEKIKEIYGVELGK